jgi:hypothetical protein
MCEICNNTLNRNYTHSLTSTHKKLLFLIMKQKLAVNFYYQKPQPQGSQQLEF